MKIKNSILFHIMVLSLLFIWLTPYISLAANTKIVRVGYPNFAGFSDVNSDGTYSGYTYEYLQEIAKYTGWEYQYVQGSPEDLLTMLEKGKIDILGGVLLNEQTAELYDFPEFNSGATYSTLFVRSDNTALSQTDYSTLNGIKVGVLKNAKKKIKDLENFCTTNGISVSLVYFDSLESLMISALQSGEVDAILGGDLRLTDNERVVAKFASNPYYFCTTKGNVEIVSSLNMAIAKINEVNLHYDTELYNKYFKQDKDYVVVLSEEEKKFINNIGELTVVYSSSSAPIQYTDKKDEKYSGISADIFNQITDITGLKFKFIQVSDFEASIKLIQNGDADIIASFHDNYGLSEKYGVTLTAPYLSMQIVMVKNNSVGINEIDNKTLAIPFGFPFTNGVNEENIAYYNTYEECIKAVNDGKADYSFINSYSVEYYTRNQFYNNISLIPMTDLTENICIGLSKPADTNLVTIINKVVHSLSDNQRQAIINKNTSLNSYKITFSHFIKSNPLESIFIVIIIGFIAISTILYFMRLQIKQKSQIELDRERYKILSDISDEFVYEYDFVEDKLIFSEKYAKTFNCEPVIPHYAESVKKGATFLGNDHKLLSQALDNKNGNTPIEIKCHIANGKPEWFRSICITICDKQNNPIRTIGKLVNIQKEKQEKDSLLEKSQMDSLTGIYNRFTSEELIKNYLKNKTNDVFGALIIIDLDYFKSVNDNLGHKSGDDVLKDLSEVLVMIFRKTDVIGRWGGDEFIVFMKDIYDLRIITEKVSVLCNIMNKPFIIENKTQLLSVSVGIAVTKENESFNELFQRGDKALYEVKANGRNGYKISI